MLKGIFSQSYNTKSATVNNAIIQLGDIDDTGKGRKFKSRFIKDGLVKIEGHGIVLLKKETLDKSLKSMIGSPVIIEHQDVTDKNADKIRCGVISDAYFNEPDGWYYAEGIIWDDKAISLINGGWSVSCSYDFLAFNDEGGEENNIKYDKEFTELNFTHLAIVNNPRYERANIVFNSKDEEKGKWVTIKGNHIFIPDGKTLDEVIEEKGWKEKEEGKSETKKESNTTKDTRKHIDRIEKLIKKYNLEPHEEDELLDELGSFEAKLDENLEPREEEALREELFDFEDDIKRHQEMKKQDKSEPEWLQREKQKLDRQTTQMYEDRYSTEHPETKKTLKDKQSDSEDKHGFKKDKDSGYYMKDLSDGTSVYVEKKAGGQGEKEPFYLEATHFDKDGKTIAKKQYHYDSMDGMFGKIDKDFVSKDKQSEIKNKTNNSKEQDMALIEELKKLIFKVENEKENKMDSKSKILSILNEKEVDKETIEEIKNEIEKMEEEKEEVKNKKKVKNEEEVEEEEKKEVDNEEEEDEEKVEKLKKEEKKDVENKCKNSKETSTFDKINAIYNSVRALKPQIKYTSRQEKLDNAVEYFKN